MTEMETYTHTHAQRAVCVSVSQVCVCQVGERGRGATYVTSTNALPYTVIKLVFGRFYVAGKEGWQHCYLTPLSQGQQKPSQRDPEKSSNPSGQKN